MPGTALITGIAGQDGTYLAQLLLSEGYRVFGLARSSSSRQLDAVAKLCPGVEFVPGDLLDPTSLVAALRISQPTEVYNLAGVSSVALSFGEPTLAGEVNGLGVTRLLEALRLIGSDAKFYQASSSEMFGNASESPQTESTGFHPRSPYATAKVYGHCSAVNYRESYGMFVCCGILFNHESPRRSLEFVTRKITNAAARIKLGLATELRLGSLDLERDWGFAGDYVEAMLLMMQHDEPDDFVIATGIKHSVRDFCDGAFSQLGLDYRDFVVSDDARFGRPADIQRLVGDASKATRVLGWEAKVGFAELVSMMVEADLAALQA